MRFEVFDDVEAEICCSWLGHRVELYLGTNVSDKYTVSIFRAEMKKRINFIPN
jgi:hypothetical protein